MALSKKTLVQRKIKKASTLTCYLIVIIIAIMKQFDRRTREEMEE